MLLLFFMGLLSYLVGMKRKTSMHVMCKRDNSHFLSYLPPRFIFWLTFLQSYILSLFFSGLFSYLGGIKRRASRRVACKRDNWLSLLCTYLPWSQNLVQAMTPILLEIIWHYLVGAYIRSSRSVAYKKDNSCFVIFSSYLPWTIPKPSSYANHNFLMIWNILVIFGRDIDMEQKRCQVQERKFLLSLLCTFSPETEILCRP